MSTNDKIRLNIGAGESNLPGFIPIDHKLGHDALKLDYADGSVDEVYSSHCLEHIHHSHAYEAVKEWTRVLKPGGRIRIAVPDVRKVLRDFSADDMPTALLSAWLHGSHDVDTDRHQAEFDEQSLSSLLRLCGIETIEKWAPEYEDCSRLPMSLNLGGYKRVVKIKHKPVVAMVLSTPRVGFVDFYSRLVEVARQLGWPFYQWGSTEWGKGLTCAIQNAIKDCNPDYIMCLDYDSVFDPKDCLDLLKLMQENPEYGALYPVEAHRHGDLPLGMNVINVFDYTTEITRVASGHFGCTMIRREVFETLPQPWFMSFPNVHTGEWSENSLDADIAFWVACTLHGWHTGQANNVQIGHMELCVKWVKPTGIMWQPIQNYRKNGKPPNAIFDGKYWEQFQTGRPKPTPAVTNESVEIKPEPFKSVAIEPAGNVPMKSKYIPQPEMVNGVSGA
jgi:hypothetical protein